MEPAAASSSRTVPRVLNPLWIISLFLGVSETIVGVATTQIAGWIQGLFAIFAIAFPLLVLIVFFFTLWKRPQVLYAPGDFPEHVTVPEFVQGMNARAIGSLELVSSTLRETLESVLPGILTAEVPESAVAKVVHKTLVGAQSSLESRAVKINVHHLAGSHGELELLIDSATTVDDLLDHIWRELRDVIRPFTYAENWVLIDGRTHQSFDQMGTRWAKAHGLMRDERPLDKVGIVPGKELTVITVGSRHEPFWVGGQSLPHQR